MEGVQNLSLQAPKLKPKKLIDNPFYALNLHRRQLLTRPAKNSMEST